MYTSPKIIFKNNSDNQKEYFFCTICSLPHTHHEDIAISRKWQGACRECFLTFIESRRKEWKEGWRPDKETLEEYIYKRHEVILIQEKK